MKLRYTLPALTDLDAALETIREKSPVGAAKVRNRIQVVISLLLQHPYVGTRTDDPVIRRVATPPYPYLVFYEPTDDELVIHAVRHSARNPSSMPGSEQD